MRRAWKPLLIALGMLGALVLLLPMLVPIPPLEGTLPPVELADPDSRFITLNDLRIHYKSRGEGETLLVLLHGFGASTYSWRKVLGPLASQGQVVAYDRPGFGLTERPLPGDWEGPSPYGPAAQVELLLGILDRFEAEQVVLIGNSAGGALALLASIEHPDRIEGLVLVDAAVYQRHPNWGLTLFRPLLRTPQMRRLGPYWMRGIRRWGRDFAASAWHDPSKLTPAIWEGYQEPLQAENWDQGLWELTIASRDLHLPAHLHEVSLPILVLTGDDDRIVPTSDSLRLAGELPNASLAVLPNCGHVPQEECPGPFLTEVERYLNGFEPTR